MKDWRGQPNVSIYLMNAGGELTADNNLVSNGVRYGSEADINMLGYIKARVCDLPRFGLFQLIAFMDSPLASNT